MNRGTIVAVVSAALLAGMLVGPPLAHAASSTLVNIEGGNSTAEANVTRADQLETTPADAADVVAAFTQSPTCAAGGFYTVPKGKALIITSVNFYVLSQGQSEPVDMELHSGPAATPCGGLLAAGVADSTADTVQNQVFQPGIPVPAGDALAAVEENDLGSVEVYGYLVPKAAVPASALSSLPSARTGRPVGIEAGK
jgi:hypothetical protein